MDHLLKDLKIISRIPQNGRIRTSVRGDIELEPEQTVLTAVTRTLSKDSRNKALRDIRRVMQQAFGTAEGLLNSKYMNIYDSGNKPSESDIDHYHEECRNLRQLGDDLTKSIIGLNNLKRTTYKDDASFGADVELLIRSIKNKILSINGRLDRLRKKGTLPKHFPRPVEIRSQTTTVAPAIIESDQIETTSNSNPLYEDEDVNGNNSGNGNGDYDEDRQGEETDEEENTLFEQNEY